MPFYNRLVEPVVVSNEAERGSGLQSEVQRLETTVRVSVDQDCPMSVLGCNGSVRHVEVGDDECIVEYSTDDLDEHCHTVERHDGICPPEDCEDADEEGVVRLSLRRPKRCICSTFKRHGCTPKIEGYADGSIVIRALSPDREHFRALVTDLKSAAGSVRIDSLRETRSTESEHTSTSVDVSVLTDTQQEFLQLALEEGYFASPRGISQAELADKLGISPSMVSRRVRSIEQRLFEQIEPALGLK
ncbi:helix-turn-helix domain-containing protein [Salinilacihabitans rarus]|uniref:helix-turn-helix domain-containing protein n=1 Tax=Salinilacihabitans rarus TaxID=2961596 RepID=UPI0020C85698|nr:helix-turn-helix domain-containing protein [Salinilacihabitans rarus]